MARIGIFIGTVYGNSLAVGEEAQTILEQARKPGRLVVTAENHSIIGGLGEAVAGVLLWLFLGTGGQYVGKHMPSLPSSFGSWSKQADDETGISFGDMYTSGGQKVMAIASASAVSSGLGLVSRWSIMRVIS